MTEDKKVILFMLECIGKVREYSQGDRHYFFTDRKTQDATIRALTMLTDVSKRLSVPAKNAMPEVPWDDIVGFRNYLVHEYLGDLNLEIVWNAIEAKLGELESALKRYKESL